MSSIKLFENQAKLNALRASTALQEASTYAPSRWSSGLEVNRAYPQMSTPLTAAADDTVEREAQRLRDERMLEDAPRTAAWVVNDPVNAGLAAPFVPQMYEVEKGARWEYGGALARGGAAGAATAYYGITNAFSFTSRFGPVSDQVSALELMDRVDNGDLSPQDVQLLEQMGMLTEEGKFRGIDYVRANPAVRQAMREQREREVDAFIEDNPEVFIELAKAYKSYLELQRKLNLSKPIGEVDNLDDFATWLGESVGQIVPQAAASIAMSVVLRRPALITGANMVFAGAQLAGEGVSKALDGDPTRMYDPQVGKGVITAAIIGAGIEKFGVPARLAGRLTGELSDSFADMLYQRVMRRVGVNAGVDAFSEAMTEVVQETVLDLIILGESATSIEEYIDMAARGAVGGGVVSVGSAPFSEARISRHLERVAASRDQAARIAQVNRTAAALEMRGTAPDRAKSYLQSVYQDKQIYVDPVALQRWADDSDASIESLGVTQEQIDAAEESGNKLAIPLADYAAVVPGTDGAKWFEENGTTDPNLPSVADKAAADELSQQLLEEYQRAAEVDAEITAARDQLVTQFEEQLIASGRPAATAPFEARAAAEMILGLARATGDEGAAFELLQRFGLRVEGPLAPSSRGAESGAAPGAAPSSAPGAVLEQAEIVSLKAFAAGKTNTVPDSLRYRGAVARQAPLRTVDADGNMRNIHEIARDIASRSLTSEGAQASDSDRAVLSDILEMMELFPKIMKFPRDGDRAELGSMRARDEELRQRIVQADEGTRSFDQPPAELIRDRAPVRQPRGQTYAGVHADFTVRNTRRMAPKRAMLLGKTTSANADAQEAALDVLLRAHPNALASERDWVAMWNDVIGLNRVPAPPWRALQTVAGGAETMVRNDLSRLTPQMIEASQAGLATARELGQLYADGTATKEHTARAFLWSFVSRMVGPYYQESAFLDAVQSPGLDAIIAEAMDTGWTDALAERYAAWAAGVSPQGSPGRSTTQNLNAFGEDWLRVMSKRWPEYDNKTGLEVLHDMLASGVSSKDIRRRYLKIGDGSGIDNKVVSFTLLLLGRTDVLVLDRVQVRNQYDDGRYGGVNVYDGVGEQKDKGLAKLTFGHIGLLMYEQLEQAFAPIVQEAYSRAGLGQGTLGRYHWDSWVASSAQEVGHMSVVGLMREIRGDADPYVGVYVKQGKFGAYDYGFQYTVMADGSRAVVIDFPGWNAPYVVDLENLGATTEFGSAVSKLRDRVTRRLGVSGKDMTRPWHEELTHDERQEFGSIVRLHGTSAPDGAGTYANAVGSATEPWPSEDAPGPGGGTRTLYQRGVAPDAEAARRGRASGRAAAVQEEAAGAPGLGTEAARTPRDEAVTEADLEKLDDPEFMREFLTRPGWGVVTASLALPDTEFYRKQQAERPALYEISQARQRQRNAEEDARLRGILRDQGIAYVPVQGMYQGVPDDVSYMIIADEATVQSLGRMFLQDSVLTRDGLIFTTRERADMRATGDVMVGGAATSQDFFSVTPGGTAFSMGLTGGPGVAVIPEGYTERADRPQLPVRPDGMVELHHWSDQPLTEIDPAYAGTGPLKGVERGRGVQLSYYGINPRETQRSPGTGYVKEAGLGPIEHVGFVEPAALYPLLEDPDGIAAGKSTSAAEEAIRAAGYLGYYVTDDGSGSNPLGNVAALFDPLPVQVVPETRTLEQPAMHGTPRAEPFNRFDLSFMGTGEGAQAYGWGLYFATRRGIAEHYRNMRRTVESPSGEVYDINLGSGQFDDMVRAMQEDIDLAGIDANIEFIVGEMLDDIEAGKVDADVSFAEFGRQEKVDADLQAALEFLDNAGWAHAGRGRVYHVDIPDNDELFYYDGTMADQPQDLMMRLLEALEGQHEVAQQDPGLRPQEKKQWKILAQNVEHNRFTFEMVYDSLGTLLSSSRDKRVRDKAASEWLRDVVGVPGHRFLDNQSRDNDVNDPANTYNFVLYDDSRIDIRSFEQAQALGPRANITMNTGALGESVIKLMAGADASSFLHEMGHWWLEAFHTLATNERASDIMQRDLATINRWLGRDADDKSPFTEDQHEQWARGVERYVYEGKAPSRALRRLFKAMASFMTGAYQSAEQLNVEISPEIRELMDRIFASQRAIAEARGDVGAGASLSPEMTRLGMTSANWEAYQKLAAASEADAAAEHLEAAMAELRTRRAGEYKERLAAERGKAEERLRQEPVYQLILGLGMKDSEFGDSARMDRAEVLDLFDTGGLDDLKAKRHGVQRNLYIKGGSPMEYVAAQFGFANPEQMMQAIRGAEPLDQAVEAEARRVVDAEFGEQMTEEAMLREAQAAYHNDARMELLAYEALALDVDGKALKGPQARAALLERLREHASEIVDSMPVVQILNLEALLAAERRAGKEAETALRKVAEGGGAQAFAQAKAAKTRQTLAAAIWNEARKRERAIDKTQKLATSLRSRKEQSKIHPTFLPHVLALLERFEFRKGQQPGTRDLPSIYELMKTLAEENAGVVPPGLVIDPGVPNVRKPYTRLSGAEMRAVSDQLTNLVKLGKDAQKEENERVKNTRAAKAGEIAGGIRVRFGTRDVPRSKSERGALHKMAANLRGLYAVTRNIFGITRTLDGEDDNGAFFRYILRPIQQAAARAEERSEDGRKRLTEILEQHYDAKARRDLNRPIMRDEVGLRLSHADILSLALNAGNDGNWARAIHESNQWTEDDVRALLDNVMTDNDWRYVQAVWDEINRYWPEVAALEKRHTGLEPVKVAGRIMVRAPAFVRGGYYPIVYDGEMSARIQELEWKTLQDAGLSGHFSKVMTRHGHTEARSGGARRALQLGLDPMFRHVTQVVRDIEMRDAVIEAHKLLNDRNLVDTMDQAGLREIHHALLAWIKDVAAGEASRTGGVNGFAKHIRRNVSLSRMGFSLTTASLQPLGLFQSAELIGWGTLLRGMVKAYSGSRASYEAVERSTIMRDRKRTMDRDMQQILRDARAAPPRSASLEDVQNWLGRYGFWLIQQLQYYVVDVPTWTAVYDRELRRGQDEETARAVADRMLAEAQGSGSQLDRSAIERGRLDLDPQSGQGHELVRLFTIMGSYMVNKWNRAASRTGQLRRGEIGPLQFAVSMVQLMVLEAAITAALRHVLSDDEDEDDDMLGAVGMKVAQDIVSTVPVAGPIAAGFVGGRGGTTAVTGYFKDLAKALKEAGDAAIDEEYEFDRAGLSALVTALGSTTGAPSVVLNRLIRAVFDEDLRPADDPASRVIRTQLGGRVE